MIILHLTKKYPGALGGDAVVVSNLQKQQVAAGHKVVIVTSNCTEIATRDHLYKVGLHDMPHRLDTITLWRMLSLILLFFQMFFIVGKEQPDIIHAHSVDMAFFASFAARFFGVPMVHTFHIVTFYDGAQSLLRRKSELWLAKRAGLVSVTAPNAYDVQKLQAAGLSQTTLLHNGVDVAFWENGNRSPRHRPFTFVTIGRLAEQKGYEYLVRAVALLADAAPDKFCVVIAGSGPQEASLQQLARDLHVDHLISLVGPKTHRQVRRLLASADAFVSPSLYETTPITVLEAWAAALPVISTPVGILRDMPADMDATYIVPAKNARALAATMRRCMANASARAAIASNGHKEVKKYAWPNIAQSAERIYRSAA